MTCHRIGQDTIVCVAGPHWAYGGQPNLCGAQGSSATQPGDISCPGCKELFRQSQDELRARWRRAKRRVRSRGGGPCEVAKG